MGVLNTICDVTFATQSPFKADGKLILVFAGMTVATDVCSVLVNGVAITSTCSSTSDNKNVTVSLVDSNSVYHYAAGTFTVKVSGIGIMKE